MEDKHMSNAALSQPERVHTAPAMGIFVSALLAAWLLLICLLAANGIFMAAQGSPPLALLIAVLAPVAAFVIAFRYVRPFRAFVLAVDPRLMLGMQAWRFAGFAFLALQTHRILPGYFALPAGLGDMAIGLTAPWLIVALSRRPEFASSRTYIVWNLLGMLDLIVAIGMGAIGSFLMVTTNETVTTAAMAQLPLVLIPAYLVPLFFMLHLTALFQARR
jgi:hypothetical protein